MYKIKLEGTYSDMGKKQGKLLKRSGFKPEEIPNEDYPRIIFANRCEKKIEQYTPEWIEYLKGIAKGGSYEYDQIKLIPMILVHEMANFPSCSIAFISSKSSGTNSPFMLRNYDWDWENEKMMLFRHMIPENGIESYETSDLWCGSYGGFNKEGLVVAMTGIPSFDADWQPGIAPNLLVSWVLNHFLSAREAGQFLKSIPHLGAFHYVIADQSNILTRIIGAPGNIHVDLFQDEDLVQTNQITVEEMRKFEIKEKIPPSSPPRFHNTLKWIEENKGNIDLERIKRYCTTPTNHGGIYEDDEFMGIKFGTIWSWIFDFKQQIFYLSSGNPQENLYKSYRFVS